MNFDLVINDGTALVFQNGIIVPQKLNIGIKDKKIVAISAQSLIGEANSSKKVISAMHLHILPGVIDSQVHFRDPGFPQKEDLESGSRAAALGGVTSFFEMPNTLPATTTAPFLNDKLSKAANVSHVNFAFFSGGSHQNISQLSRLENTAGSPGIKVFVGSSTGTLLVEDDPSIEKILRSTQRRVVFHSEDENLLKSRKSMVLPTADPRMHSVWRNEETGFRSTARLIKLAQKTGRKIHILHISSMEEMDLIRSAKKLQNLVSCEILPQYLILSAPDCYDRWKTLAQQNPPIRDHRHMKYLWQAVLDKTVDVMGSDHAPHTLAEKNRPYPQSPSGMPMVQTMVPLMLHQVAQQKISLERLVELWCEKPREIFGCKTKGRIEVGLDADFTLVDLKKKKQIQNSWIASKCGWTLFDGYWVQGWVEQTVVMGEVVMESDQVLHGSRGQKVLFS